MRKKLIQLIIMAFIIGAMIYIALKFDAFKNIFFWNH